MLSESEKQHSFKKQRCIEYMYWILIIHGNKSKIFKMANSPDFTHFKRMLPISGHLCLDQCPQLSGLDWATSVWIKFQKPTSKKGWEFQAPCNIYLISYGSQRQQKTCRFFSHYFKASIWIDYIFYLASIQVFWISSVASWPFSQQIHFSGIKTMMMLSNDLGCGI